MDARPDEKRRRRTTSTTWKKCDETEKDTYGSPRIVRAHGSKQAALPPNGKNLLDHENQQQTASRRQVDVVELEQRCELHGLTALHHLTQRENRGEVSDEACNNDRDGRERGDSGLVRREVGRQMPFFWDDGEQSVGEGCHGSRRVKTEAREESGWGGGRTD